MPSNQSVDQSSAKAGGNIVAGDLTVHNHYESVKATIVEQLLAKLNLEREKNAMVQATIESLRYYYEHKSHDGVVGLQAKLEKGNRTHEVFHAIEKKELFAKTLEKWSMYASAQEIFAHLLARAEFAFTSSVLPQIDKLDEVEINGVIATQIVEPIVADCGVSVFQINHAIAMGMFYWLAEQCFVRWHK